MVAAHALMLWAIVAQAPTEVLTLTQTLDRIRDRSPALLAARAQIDAADGEVSKAWSPLKPQLDAFGVLTLNSSKTELDVAGVLDDFAKELGVRLSSRVLDSLPDPILLQPHLQLEGVLRLSQGLFDLAVIRGIPAAEANRAGAAARAIEVEESLLFQGATLFVTARGVVAMEAAARRAVTVAEGRLEAAKAHVATGGMTSLDVTRAELDLVVAAGEQAALNVKRRSALAWLGALIGANEPVDVSLDRLPNMDPVSASPVGDLAKVPAVHARRAELDAAQKRAGVHAVRWVPRLAVEGRFAYSNTQGFSDEPYLAQAIATLHWPLYDGGARYADMKIADAAVRQARHALTQAELHARAQLEEARAQLEEARAAVAQAHARRVLSDKEVRETEDLLSQGMTTQLDLRAADARRFAAERAVAGKEAALELALLRVHHARGTRLSTLLGPSQNGR